MYTLLQILAISLSVISSLGAILWLFLYGLMHSEAYDYSNGGVTEENTIKRKRYAKRLWWTPLFLVPIMLFIGLSIFSSRNLAETECETRNGVWASWDNGFAWDCTNPNQITQDNNFRVITD